MTSKFKLFILFFSILFAIGMGCRKPIPEGQVSDPELMFSGSFNGERVLWIAGISGCVQRTDYSTDSLGVTLVSAKFEDCNSGKQLIIELYPKQSNDVIDNTLSEGRRLISPDPMTTYYDVRFKNESYSRFNAGFLWDFGDGQESTELNPVRRFKADSSAYEICLKATANQVTSEICETYIPGLDCATDFHWELNPYKWKFFGAYAGSSQVQWDWVFASGITSQSKVVDYPYPSAVSQDKVCLTAQSQTGCLSKRCQNVIVDSNAVDVVANFSYEETFVQEPEPGVLYSTARIIYTDSEGTTFYSDGEENKATSFLSISNADIYNATSSGISAKKLIFSCEAILKSASGDRIVLRNGSGEMAFRLSN